MFYQIGEGHKIINEGPKPETDLERRIRELEQENADLRNELRAAMEKY